LRRIARWAIPALRRAPYGLVAALVLARFADEWAAFLPAGALEPLRGELGLTYAQAAGVLVALPAGGLVGAGLVVAADYVSRRLLASLGAIAYGLALIVFGLAHSLTVLLAAAFVWGAASDAFVHGCEVALADLAGEALPLALARMNGWAAVGDLLGPLTLAAAATLGLGWRGAFLVGGGLMIFYAAALARQPLPPPHPRVSPARPLGDVRSILADRRVLEAAIVLGLFALLDEPLAAFMIAYLERVRRLTPGLAYAPVMAMIVGHMAGFALFERFTGERTPRAVLLACAGILVCVLPAAMFAPLLAIETLAALAFGAAGAVFYTTMQAATLALRPRQVGAVSAVISLIGMLGMGFPALVGIVADSHGLAAALGLYAAVPVVILALVALARR
jgi:predicted MFS family arabinose efflux permease